MTQMIPLTRAEMDRLQSLATAAVENVSRGLTEMFNADVTVTALHIRVAPLAEIAGIVGDPGMEVAGSYLAADGALSGHLLLLMQVPVAYELCDILLEQPPGTTTELGEMEASAIGEVGNIVGSFFLNAISDRVGQVLHITPPGVLCDMAGACIDLALAEVAMTADEAIVIDANFEHRGRRLPAWFLAFPEPARLRAVLAEEGAE